MKISDIPYSLIVDEVDGGVRVRFLGHDEHGAADVNDLFVKVSDERKAAATGLRAILPAKVKRHDLGGIIDALRRIGFDWME